MLFYQEHFAHAVAGFEAEVRATVKLLFRTGSAAGKGKPALTAFTRANGGWFGAGKTAPDVPRDAAVLTEEDEHRYTAALEAGGFFGPDSWYVNAPANAAFAARAKAHWQLTMPVLFMHAAHDYVCETIDSQLAKPMRAHCEALTDGGGRVQPLDGSGKSRFRSMRRWPSGLAANFPAAVGLEAAFEAASSCSPTALGDGGVELQRTSIGLATKPVMPAAR